MPKHQLRLMMADQSVFGFGRVALKRLALKQSLHKKGLIEVLQQLTVQKQLGVL